jgi:hypothetical protein
MCVSTCSVKLRLGIVKITNWFAPDMATTSAEVAPVPVKDNVERHSTTQDQEQQQQVALRRFRVLGCVLLQSIGLTVIMGLRSLLEQHTSAFHDFATAQGGAYNAIPIAIVVLLCLLSMCCAKRVATWRYRLLTIFCSSWVVLLSNFQAITESPRFLGLTLTLIMLIALTLVLVGWYALTRNGRQLSRPGISYMTLVVLSIATTVVIVALAYGAINSHLILTLLIAVCSSVVYAGGAWYMVSVVAPTTDCATVLVWLNFGVACATVGAVLTVPAAIAVIAVRLCVRYRQAPLLFLWPF